MRSHRRLALWGLIGVAAVLTPGATAAACSTAGLSVRQVARVSTVIVLAEVVEAPGDGRNYRLHVIEVIKGDVDPGELVIGPPAHDPPPPQFPDCWLSLPVGQRVVIALPDPHNLDALASYAWWEEQGQLVTASPVDAGPPTVAGLLAELHVDPPETDTGGDTPSPAWPLHLLLVPALLGTLATILRLRHQRPPA